MSCQKTPRTQPPDPMPGGAPSADRCNAWRHAHAASLKTRWSRGALFVAAMAVGLAGCATDVPNEQTPLDAAAGATTVRRSPADGQTVSDATRAGQAPTEQTSGPTSLSLPLTIRPRMRSAEPATDATDSAQGVSPTAPLATHAFPEGCAPDTAYRDGGALAVGGQAFAFLGVNAQYLLDPAFPEAEVDALLAALASRNVSVVRVWFLEGYDDDRFERTIDAAARHGIRLVVALDDNVPRGRSWLFSDDDEERYRPHLVRTVSRHRDRPEILMWEPTNEANCGDQYDRACIDTIKDWLTMSSRLIKEHDPCHLVSSGLIGAGNYDPEREEYRRLHQRDSIDVLSVHRGVDDDRDHELRIAADLDAPIVYGEIYDLAYDEGCGLLEGGKVRNRRAERVKDDFRDALRDGVDGYLLWDLAAGSLEAPDGSMRHYCGVFGYELTDPVWRVMAEADLPPPVPWQ